MVKKCCLVGCGILLFLQQSICGQIMFPSQPVVNFTNLTKISESSRQAFQEISAGSEKFAIGLFRRTAEALATVSANTGVNREDFIMSPFSVWSLLTLIAEGAEGNTMRELNDALGLTNDLTNVRKAYSTILAALNVKSAAVELSTTQAMFSDINRPVKNDFSFSIQSNYGAYLDSVDFTDKLAAAQKINQYVSNSTSNRIRRIVTQDDLKDSQLLLLSAIYFRGQWKFPFNASHTKEEQFYDEDGNASGTVNMMTQKGTFAYTAIADLDSHVLELPYGNQDRLSMVVLMPRKGIKLLSVIEKLENIRLERIFKELEKAAQEYEDDEVEVHLPKFTITTDFTLNTILMNMGIRDVFDPQANLNKISSNNEVFLSRLIHKAKIEVNEEGTLAVAVTSGLFSNKASPPRFLANRPFMYFIVDKMTNLLLFCGTVKNPEMFKNKS